jgi:hypothetical protein
LWSAGLFALDGGDESVGLADDYAGDFKEFVGAA